MSELDEIAQLKAQVDQLTAENAALREAGFRVEGRSADGARV
jgi:cell division protein FtsB